MLNCWLLSIRLFLYLNQQSWCLTALQFLEEQGTELARGTSQARQINDIGIYTTTSRCIASQGPKLVAMTLYAYVCNM